MTPQVLYDAMTGGCVDPSLINLIIFDECHGAVGKAYYRQIMIHIFQTVTDQTKRPLVLGLTATIVNDKAPEREKVRAGLSDLEETFRAAVVGPREVTGSKK